MKTPQSAGMDVVKIGESYSFHKTITEADVTLYGGLVGDLGRIHFDDEFAKQTKYGRRLAMGTFMVGLMSAPQSVLGERLRERGAPPNVSYGYDRVRFPAPVFIGDTLTVRYRVALIEPERDRSYGTISVTNQHGTQVAAAEHILKWVRDTSVDDECGSAARGAEPM